MSDAPYSEILADEEFAPLRRNAACHQCKKRKGKCDGVSGLSNLGDQVSTNLLRRDPHALRAYALTSGRSRTLSAVGRLFPKSAALIRLPSPRRRAGDQDPQSFHSKSEGSRTPALTDTIPIKAPRRHSSAPDFPLPTTSQWDQTGTLWSLE